MSQAPAELASLKARYDRIVSNLYARAYRTEPKQNAARAEMDRLYAAIREIEGWA